MNKEHNMKTVYHKYHNEMIEKSPAYRNFARGIHTEATIRTYVSTLRLKIMPFAVEKEIISHIDAFDELVKLDSEQITDFMLDFIDTQTVKSKSIVSYISAIEKFFDMNRKIFHKKIVRNSIAKDTELIGGSVPVTDDEVYQMIQATLDVVVRMLNNKEKENKTGIRYIPSGHMRKVSVKDYEKIQKIINKK